jgi:hypothetical protein
VVQDAAREGVLLRSSGSPSVLPSLFAEARVHAVVHRLQRSCPEVVSTEEEELVHAGEDDTPSILNDDLTRWRVGGEEDPPSILNDDLTGGEWGARRIHRVY